MKNRTKAELALVLATLVWGSSFLIVKNALTESPPFWFLTLRFSLAAAVCALLFPRVFGQLNRERLRCGFVVAVFLYVGFALQTAGLRFTTPAKSAFVTGSCVVVVPVISLLAFRTGFSRKVGVGVGLAFAGLFLLTRPDDLVNLNRGDVLTFCGAVAFAFQIIYLERYTRRVPTDSLAVLQLLWTMLLSLPAGLLVDGPRFSYGWSFYAAVIYLAVFCSALAFLAQARAQKHVSATRAALIFSLEPVFAAIASFLFYGERLSAVEWLGGAMTVAGVILGEVPVLRSKTEQVRHNDV